MFAFVRAHKILTVVAVAALSYGGYWYQQSKSAGATSETRYVLATVTKGTLITSVSGTGQVVADQQVDVKPKASGRILSVRVAKGAVVKEGQVLVTLDAGDALKAVRDAQISLETAQLNYDKLVRPAGEDDLYSAQNALVAAEESVQEAEKTLTESYENGLTTVSSAFLELPDAMSDLHDVLFGTDINGVQANIDLYTDRIEDLQPRTVYAADARATYDEARAKYDAAFASYKAASRTSDQATIEALVHDTYGAAVSAAEAVKSATNMVQFYKDKTIEKGKNVVPQAASHLSTLGGLTSTLNGQTKALSTADGAFDDARQGLVQAKRTVGEKTRAIEDIKEGADVLDIRSLQITLDQKKEALADARATLADYTVTAPISGTIATLDATSGTDVSTGTTLASIVTLIQVASISLGEVDVAKVSVGQAATMTFDAVPDLAISGKVVDIDTVGTSSQGVVTYKVRLSFDLQDEQIKPSMTTSASIIVKTKTDVLLVPSSAVKSSGQTKYVEVARGVDVTVGTSTSKGVALAIPPEKVTVTVGDSNDDSIEILSGLSEGDTVVTSTLTSSTGTSGTSGGGGGVFGIPGAGAATGARMQLR